ncbi:MAG TPA: cytochrome D1 domain-containing protein [Candidatus Sulfomarinibacteraceae bacterium]|nr:cytochrome D1 domain-containing protein [Candidatus Sulfomarinibacteraceae bacterium]
MVRKGIRVEFSVAPVSATGNAAEPIVAGHTAEARFRITEADTGAPVSPLQPAVWISSEEPGSENLSCRERIGRYVQGMLGFQADVDLNKYFLLILNDDASISVVDPLLGVSGITQLYGMVPLDEPGADWLTSPDGERLYVTMPAAGRMAVVDLSEFEVTASLDVGTGPLRLALQPDGRYLWVANDDLDGGGGGVTVVDTVTLERVRSVATGRGHHELAFTADSRFALVTNDADGTVSVIDTQELEKVADVPTGDRPVAVRFSQLSESAYVADLDGTVAVIREGDWTVARKIDTGAGVAALELDPSGRWGFAAQTGVDRVAVLDLSQDAVVHRLEVGSKPFQFAFTDTYAYVRHLGTAEVKLIPLPQLAGRDTVGVQGVVFGNLAPEEYPYPTAASSITPTGEYGAVMAANPADRMVYYYMEGMIAPMGSYSAYGRVPKAVGIVDRSVRETEPGVYSARFRVPSAGEYDVSFLLDTPLIDHCFNFEAVSDPEAAAGSADDVELEFLNQERESAVGEGYPVRFSVKRSSDGSPVTDLADVVVIATRPPGSWQTRLLAGSLGDGTYQVTIPPDQPGVYYVTVEIPSLGFDVTELPFMTFVARAQAPAETPRG